MGDGLLLDLVEVDVVHIMAIDYINIKEIIQLWHYCIMWLKYQIWDEYHHSLLEQHPVGELAELLRRHRLLALPRWPLVHFWTVGSQIAPPSALVRFALLLPLLQPHQPLISAAPIVVVTDFSWYCGALWDDRDMFKECLRLLSYLGSA